MYEYKFFIIYFICFYTSFYFINKFFNMNTEKEKCSSINISHVFSF